MQLDGILVQLGGFGPYQKRIFLLCCYPFLVCAFPKLMWVFLAAELPHRCKLPGDGHSTYHLPVEVLNASIPWNSDKSDWDSCTIYDFDQVHEENTTKNVSRSVSCDKWIYDHSQYKTSAVSEFDLVCDNRWLVPFAISLQMGGEFIGALLLGILSDRFGRRLILVISGIMLSVVGILSTLLQGVSMLIVSRILIGFWTPGIALTSYVIGMEFVAPTKRVYAGIVSQYFFALGYLLIAVSAYFVRDWRTLQIALSVPCALTFAYMWIVPESVRWLMVNNKMNEAMAIVKKIASSNKIYLSEDFFRNEFKLEEQPQPGTLKDLMRYPNLRKRTLIVMFSWFANSCVYYGFSFNTSNLAGNDYINFGLAATVEFPAYTVCLLTVEKIGRKYPLCAGMILAGITLFISPFVASRNSVVDVVVAMFGKFAITVSYAVLFMYTAEVFPTVVRSASFGLSSTCGRIGAILAPFLLMFKMYWMPLPPVIFSIFALSSGILCMLLPDTVGRKLPDTIEEGEDFTRLQLSRETNSSTEMKPSDSTEITKENCKSSFLITHFHDDGDDDG